jgi:hypothetical protein
MPRLSILMVLMVICPAAGATASAQDTATPPATTQTAPGDDGRYSFHRSGDGFIRLDSRTGEVAQCGWGSTGWACKLVPDERAALESEIGRLQRDNADLKKSLLSHNIELPNGMVAKAQTPTAAAPVPPADVPDPSAKVPPQVSPQVSPQGPTDAEIDRAFAFMKNVWRRLVDMMADLQRDIQKKS